MENKQKTILIVGDYILDVNIVKSRDIPLYHQDLPNIKFINEEYGGVIFLYELIKRACSDISDKINIIKPNMIDKENITKAYQIWDKFPKVDDKDSKTDVFRIEQFLGCIKPETEIKQNSNIIDRKYTGEPNLLVIDDIGLGFCNSDKNWPKTLKDARLENIILKTSSLPWNTLLWKHLKEKGLLDKLTLVISAGLLRSRGALISKALSWDQTIEDIIYEFENGASSQDIAQCRRVIVVFGDEGVASIIGNQQNTDDGKAKLERFLYNPNYLEGDWEAKRRGRIFGTLSIMASAIVRYELSTDDKPYPLYIALSRALKAICEAHEEGAGESGPGKDKFFDIVESEFHPKNDGDDANKGLIYCSTIDHSLLHECNYGNQNRIDLLRDSLGNDIEYVYAKAIDVVLHGFEKSLSEIPKVSYGKYLTVDREEIERINAIRNLINSYMHNQKDNRPLSIAVFGAPGSGKNFAIKHLVASLLGEKVREINFNLSQIDPNGDDLIEAFHKVRDASIESQFPLVFWDEFDTNDLYWLSHFLAPMEESKFYHRGTLHPFGKTIFIFAGGTCPSFEEFSREKYRNDEKNYSKYEEFIKKKGPDFISRLRGYINIKGPNPIGIESCSNAIETISDEQYKKFAQDDIAYLIRRAIVLRASLQELIPSIIGKDKIASISTGVIRGFLLAKKYLHGSRSINTIVRMSSVADNQKSFSVSNLPSKELLRLHVTKDFIEEIIEGELEKPVIDELARECHTYWKNQKEAQGWKYGIKRDDSRKIHNLLVDYDDLDEKTKEELNRKPARLTKSKIIKAGFKIVKGKTSAGIDNFDEESSKQIKIIEHDIWLREHLIKGYEYAKETNETLKIHRCATKFEKMSTEDQQLDDAIVRSFIPTLKKFGYSVVKEGISSKK